MDYLTEEELFELQYQDEMDVMDEIDICGELEVNFNLIKNGGSDTQPKDSEKADEEKENIPVTLPPRRRLSFSTDISQPNSSKNNTVCEIVDDSSQYSQSLTQGKSKQTLTDVLDNADDVNSPSVTLPPRRRLSFSTDISQPNSSKDNTDCEIVEDSSQYCQSLTQEKSKRTLADVLDNADDNSPSAKKTRLSFNETLENFLKDKVHSQARPSFFEEVRSFSKDQQMITCIDGHRKYYSVNEEEDPQNLFPSFSQRTSSLLSIPIDVLKQQYFIMEEENELRKQSEETAQISFMDEDISEEKDVESSLWVEKYRPLSYMHLLSEEGINRTLLQWLKLWDKVVFGKEKKVKKKPAIEPKKNFQNPKFKKPSGELIDELDEHDRPHHKVAFLCGPPGLGKTTLATIIAKHAGYNVVELNASDDRSPEVFRTNLEAATQMKAVLDKNRKPNCLILDEIDGAPAPSINVLLSFIKSTGIPKGGKRKKGDIPLLVRPIICICNDPYSPALKPLRQIALVLNFPPTTTSRLSGRLNEISMREGLFAEMAALTLLCEKSSNDIRSCLSTLQFVHRMKNDLKVADIEGLTIGQKDMQKTLFAVWQEVFYCKEKPSFDAIYNTINSFGDYDKVSIGIYENYANIKFKHRNANNVWDGAEWLCFGDIIQQEIFHSQSYFLLPYLPYPVVAFHLMFSSNSFPHISYPATFYEYKSRSIQLSNTILSLIKDMVSTLKTFLNTNLLLIDVFPFLLEIIKPSLRPVNTQLYSEREKSELKRVIDLMLAFNLNYRQERMQDGTYNYVLDPNIEELTKFSGIKSNKPLTYSAKQMIAREVEMEQMRKGEAATDQKIASTQEKYVKPALKLQIEPIKKAVPEIERPMVDFFGRKITATANTKKKDIYVAMYINVFQFPISVAKGDPRDEQVWFHFKEGYSNAVRRTVYIKDLL